jgi:hypothetical protein
MNLAILFAYGLMLMQGPQQTLGQGTSAKMGDYDTKVAHVATCRWENETLLVCDGLGPLPLSIETKGLQHPFVAGGDISEPLPKPEPPLAPCMRDQSIKVNADGCTKQLEDWIRVIDAIAKISNALPR